MVRVIRLRFNAKEFAAKKKLEIVASLCEAQTAKEPVKISARTTFCKRKFYLINLKVGNKTTLSRTEI